MRQLPPDTDHADCSAADDARQVVAAQADRHAFAPLYERYVTPIYRYCLHRLGSREAAEDACRIGEFVMPMLMGTPVPSRSSAFESIDTEQRSPEPPAATQRVSGPVRRARPHPGPLPCAGEGVVALSGSADRGRSGCLGAGCVWSSADPGITGIMTGMR